MIGHNFKTDACYHARHCESKLNSNKTIAFNKNTVVLVLIVFHGSLTMHFRFGKGFHNFTKTAENSHKTKYDTNKNNDNRQLLLK